MINKNIIVDPGSISTKLEDSKDELVKNFILKNCISDNEPLKNFIDNIEKDMIDKALKVSAGNQRVASFILGLKPTTLNEKIRKFKIIGYKKPKKYEDLKALVKDLGISRL